MKKRYVYIFLFMSVLCAVGLTGKRVEAKTLTGYSHEYADKSGRYIYYAAPESSLKRYDTKTGKTKTVYSCKAYDSYTKKKELTNGFSNPTVQGKYIYVQWTKGHGTSGSIVDKSYIYRISKDGKKAKKLSLGANPVLVGNRIYYDEVKKVNVYGDWWYQKTGKKMSMKLNGEDKRLEKVTIKVKKRKLGKYKMKVKDYPYPSYATDKNGRTYNQALILTRPNGKRVKLAKWWSQ